MAMSLQDLLDRRPADRETVEAEKAELSARVHAYRLRELREAAGLTQQELAERIGVSQRQVSKLECGDLENSRIGTVRSYLRAVGGDLQIEYVIPGSRVVLI